MGVSRASSCKHFFPVPRQNQSVKMRSLTLPLLAVLVVVLTSGIDCRSNYRAKNLVDNKLRSVLEKYIDDNLKPVIQKMYDENNKTIYIDLMMRNQTEESMKTLKKLESYIAEKVTKTEKSKKTDVAKAWRQKSRLVKSGHIAFFMMHVLLEYIDENFKESTVKFDLSGMNGGKCKDGDSDEDYGDEYEDYDYNEDGSSRLSGMDYIDEDGSSRLSGMDYNDEHGSGRLSGMDHIDEDGSGKDDSSPDERYNGKDDSDEDNSN